MKQEQQSLINQLYEKDSGKIKGMAFAKQGKENLYGKNK